MRADVQGHMTDVCFSSFELLQQEGTGAHGTVFRCVGVFVACSLLSFLVCEAVVR